MATAPVKIKIGPLDYAVRWFDRTEEDKEARYGYCDNNDLEIGVSNRLPDCKKADTFMHEAVHALWYVLGLPNKASEEEVASRYGIGLSMIARDNPAIFEWWLDLLK